MYKLEYLPIAKKDIENIVNYIFNVLKNRSAAINISNLLIDSVISACKFPYGLPVYYSIGDLEIEYRCIKVKNYLMFYTIDEKNKTITIARVLYKKMNITNILYK